MTPFQKSRTQTIPYRPEIDGLRTIAVLAVVFFHLGVDCLKGGFLGVDVFFVISGFLITSIIYSQMLLGTFSIVAFWKRRIKRLYPALTIMIGVVLLIGAFLLIRPERADLPLQAIAGIFSFENILLWRTTGGYWATSSENIALLHTWSLSLEEQFYISFPILLLILNNFTKSKERYILIALFAVFTFSFCLCLYGTLYHRNASFYLLPTRMWELLLGSILAVYKVNNPSGGALRLVWLPQSFGLALIILSFFIISNNEYFPGYRPMLACIGTLLILIYGAHNGPIKSLLSFKPVVYIGKLSYSLYLYHWPVIFFLKYIDPNSNIWLPSILMFVLAILSYHLIECPFRHGHRRPRLIIAILTGAVIACFVPILILPTSPLIHNLGNIDSETSMSRGWEFEATEHIRNGYLGKIVVEGKPNFDLCIIGSSHARVLCGPLAIYAKYEGLSFLSMATSGIGLTTTTASTEERFDANMINRYRLQNISAVKPRIVIVAGMWSSESKGFNFSSNLSDILRFLCSHAENVIVLGQVPLIELPDNYGNHEMKKYLIAQSLRGGPLFVNSSRYVRKSNQIVEDTIKTLNTNNIIFLNPYYLFIDSDERVALLRDGIFLYSDYNHVNDMGASFIFETLLRETIRSMMIHKNNTANNGIQN